jgi:hypothetical protein
MVLDSANIGVTTRNGVGLKGGNSLLASIDSVGRGCARAEYCHAREHEGGGELHLEIFGWLIVLCVER